MTEKITKISKKIDSSLIFLFLSLFLIFFPARHVFFTSEAFKTGAYSDFTSFSLYLCDLGIISGIRYFIFPNKNAIFQGNFFKWVFAFLAILLIEILVRTGEYLSLNIYFFFRFVEITLVAYGTFYLLLQKENYKLWFIKIFVLLGFVESLIAIGQFLKQSSIGMGSLGESLINPNIPGVAKIVVNGAKYVRAYGTFPHPNLLSAFLLTVILLNIWLILRKSEQTQKIWLYFALIVNIFGIFLTFSRASYLALFVSLLTIALGIILKKTFSRKYIYLIIFLASSFALAFFTLKPFLLTRATIEDQASLERIFYAKIGWQIVKTHPLAGVGLGESVLHMQQYSSITLQSWQIQPVHNYFLLAAAEMGIPAALLLLIIFMLHVKQLLQSIKQDRGEGMELKIILLGIFIGFLVLMQFDHYFYTLEQTQLLLWIILGFMAAEFKQSAN